MITSVRVMPNSERSDADHSFILAPSGASPLFAGWGPRL